MFDVINYIKGQLFVLVLISVPLVSLFEFVYGYIFGNVYYIVNGVSCFSLLVAFCIQDKQIIYKFASQTRRAPLGRFYYFIAYFILVILTVIHYFYLPMFVLIPNFVYLFYGFGLICPPFGVLLVS